ncbi:hypothetical protein ABID49_002266 [Bhargavaea ullalensis]|uniref:Uncharacterized protein n=1 Tax=Bhargavaea ullalensis TaxID=1265685 RepID=A0ABV2GDI3_9BACL
MKEKGTGIYCRSQTVAKVSLVLLWLQFFFFLNFLRISAAGPRLPRALP